MAPADRSQKLKAEFAPDHRGGCQHPLFTVAEPLEAAADDQPHTLWDVALVDLDVGAELAGLIKDFPSSIRFSQLALRQEPIRNFSGSGR